MLATSSNVLSNVVYLVGAVLLAVAGILVVWWRHREPTSVDAKMASFQKGLSALAPDKGAVVSVRDHGDHFKVRPVAPHSPNAPLAAQASADADENGEPGG
ncbi:MAG: hypothetical protein ACP5P1_05990 [Acidimicrobiales bacterium]